MLTGSCVFRGKGEQWCTSFHLLFKLFVTFHISVHNFSMLTAHCILYFAIGLCSLMHQSARCDLHMLWLSLLQGDFFTKSLMHTRNTSVAEITYPWNTSWQRNNFLLWGPFSYTLVLLLFKYDSLYRLMLPWIPHCLSFTTRSSFYNLSNAYLKSTYSSTIFLFFWKASSFIWDK